MTSSNTARRLLAGAAWVYGAQMVTVIAQFAYAALTSRAVTPGGFGAYAVALSVTGLVSLLATGGLGQTVSRMVELEKQRLRSLVTYALLLGSAGAGAVYLSAPFWSWLWGVDSSLDPIRWLAISSLFSPLVGLSTGLMARTGRFKQLGLVTVCSNLCGMIVGAVAVSIWRSPSSLVISAIVAQFMILVGTLLASEGLLLGLSRLRHGHRDIGYSGKLMSASFLSYLTGNIVKFSMTRAIDAAILGYWNRAEVLTTIPFQQIQTALIRAVYPEFRHDVSEPSRAKVVWTDMLVLVGWAALILSALVAVLVPPLVPIIFGAGWEVAASLAGPLAVIGGLQIVSILLNSAIEALGRFRWIWSTDVVLIFLQICAAAMIFIYKDVWIAVAALVLTNVVRHGWQVWIAGRHGYIDLGRLLGQYLLALAFSSILALTLWVTVQSVMQSSSAPAMWGFAFAAIGGFAALCLAIREKFPIVVLGRKYGFIRKS
jgi:O-antigen/teichoic acid export membrane protein